MTLVDQSEGLAPMVPSPDAESAETSWQSALCHQTRVVQLYRAGRSLNSIAIDVGIAWDSVALLLEKAGARARRKRRPAS